MNSEEQLKTLFQLVEEDRNVLSLVLYAIADHNIKRDDIIAKLEAYLQHINITLERIKAK